ncbi:MAG: SDR family oxidoreductase [Planctomycetota bacterium]|nr:SDR family oxidoreductase [Planctomycetota bacterium]MDA1249534.1 SDR family oxidoreductase [Planctomycetota bacterium]
MNYHILLTGATGLLGRYLLRDLMLAGVSVAVVVRRSRRQSAQQRVDSLMATWEDRMGREFPRPKVLEGDLTEENLGLSASDVAWVRANCDSVLHNAASLTFVSTDPEGEPWRSNVKGTQNVLDLCEKTGIKDFHHVSTSYVCGLRSDGDTVLETQLDVGQTLGNDYEKSKVQAEKMIRSAEFLSPPTVYRPAIIVGDSNDGFTTTFHGFYASLHLAYTLMKSFNENETRQSDIPTRVTLDGTERKNLVPVDWVSAATVHILTNREFHGETYHLTPTEPVTVSTIRNVLEEAYGFKGAVFTGHGSEIEDPNEIEQLFYEHFKIYDSYWRDDPTFDASQTIAACPHLPCPIVDQEKLLMMAHAAIDMDFRWKDAPVKTETPKDAPAKK